MGDIVDELQNYIPGMPVGWLLDEAKGEIEALRAEVERLKLSTVDLAAMKKALEKVDRLRAESERQRALFNDMCGTAKRALKDLGKANDEIERLRAALRQALGWIDNWDCAFKDDPEWRQYAPQIRAALTQEKPNDP